MTDLITTDPAPEMPSRGAVVLALALAAWLALAAVVLLAMRGVALLAGAL